MMELDKDEQEILKKIIEREKALNIFRKWVLGLLYILVPISTLWTFYNYLKGH